jgi:hypothetical protein
MVWLLLDELDEAPFPDQGQVRKLLDLLYARAEITPWLRFVLLGVEAVPVSGTGPFTEREFLGPTSAPALVDDVADYLARRFESRSAPGLEQIVKGVAVTAVTPSLVACGGKLDHPSLLRKVVDSILLFELTANLRSA